VNADGARRNHVYRHRAGERHGNEACRSWLDQIGAAQGERHAHLALTRAGKSGSPPLA
jgi:hypothetical protein